MLSGDLAFLLDVFSKARIYASVVSVNEPVSRAMDKSVECAVGINSNPECTLKEYLPAISSNTMYRIVEPLGLKFIYMRLPELNDEELLMIGPYSDKQFTDSSVFELAEKYNVPPGHQKLLRDYLISLPVAKEDSHLYLVIDAFCERVFGIGAYTVEDIDRASIASVAPSQQTETADAQSVLAGMKLMETRYSIENELMRMVSKGQIGKIDMLLPSFSIMHFEQRVPDRLRNIKNYCIVTNTLLRKAAENGGVHPLNIDRLSSEFAIKTELCMSVEDCTLLIKDMFRSYCRLVNKHSVKGMSPIIQKAVFLIESELAGDLSLSRLAEATNVSSGYLSALFKQQTGKTVTEYVTDKRISYAVYLLDTTHLQVQTVAANCGIMDLQYFSKLFKKKIGKTPREYREERKK